MAVFGFVAAMVAVVAFVAFGAACVFRRENCCGARQHCDAN
jgi:hypothetical protein